MRLLIAWWIRYQRVNKDAFLLVGLISNGSVENRGQREEILVIIFFS